jgi:F-type H+-transporting ATPase subunit epsilon
LEIITPERIAYQQDVDYVEVPSVTGELGILPKHVPLFTTLKDGEVRIIKGKEELFLAIGGGFLEVTPQKTAILVTRAMHAEEINEKEMEKAKEEAELAIKQKPQGEASAEAWAMLRSTLVNLNVLRKYKGRKDRLHQTSSGSVH